MFHVRPREGEVVTALGSTYTTKSDGGAVSGAYSLVEERFWGDPTPLHRHVDSEEAFYVLEGRVALWVDGDEVIAEPGAFVVVPRGAAHAARRVDGEVRMLTLFSPPGVQGFFSAVVEEGEVALLQDPERLIELAAAYRTEVLGDHPTATVGRE